MRERKSGQERPPSATAAADRGAGRLTLLWWTVYAAAFGYCEAMVVVYIRRLLGMGYGVDYRQTLAAQGVPFTSDGMLAYFAGHGLLALERGREAATLVLLAAGALAAGRTGRERLALFLYTFAAWDLAYYLFLIPLIGFPRTMEATDIYFLVPIAWYGPVWFPVCLVMPALILIALRLLRADARRGESGAR